MVARAPAGLLVALALAAVSPAARAERRGALDEGAPAPGEREWVEVGYGLRFGVGNTAIAVSSRRPRVVFIGTDVGFVYRSIDGGVTWDEVRLLPDDVPLLSVPLMDPWGIPFPNDGLSDSSCPPALDVGGPASSPPYGARGGRASFTGWSLGYATPGERAFFGMDCMGGGGARTETEDPANLMALYFSGVSAQAGRVNWLDVCATDPSVAFAATNFGVFRTRDTGITWDRVFIGSSEDENRVNGVQCHPGDAAKVFIVTAQGMRVSRDGGDAWERPTGNLGNWGGNYVTVDPRDPGRLLVGTDMGAYETDLGAATERQIFVTDQPSPDARVVKIVRATAADPNVIYIGTLDAGFFTHDGGRTWHRMGELVLGRDWVRSIVVDPDDALHAYLITWARLFETFDGGLTLEERALAYTDYQQLTADPVEPGAFWLLGYSQVWKYELVAPRPVRDTPLTQRARWALEADPGLDAVTERAFEIGQIDMASIVDQRRRILRSSLVPRIALMSWFYNAWGDRSVAGQPAGLGFVADYLDLECTLNFDPIFCEFAGRPIDVSTSDRGTVPFYGAFLVLTWPFGRARMDERLTGRLWIDIQRMRERVQYDIYDSWTDRNRLLRGLARGDTTPEEERAYLLRLEETTAVLDGMTGNLLDGPFGDGW